MKQFSMFYVICCWSYSQISSFSLLLLVDPSQWIMVLELMVNHQETLFLKLMNHFHSRKRKLVYFVIYVAGRLRIYQFTKYLQTDTWSHEVPARNIWRAKETDNWPLHQLDNDLAKYWLWNEKFWKNDMASGWVKAGRLSLILYLFVSLRLSKWAKYENSTHTHNIKNNKARGFLWHCSVLLFRVKKYFIYDGCKILYFVRDKDLFTFHVDFVR